MVRKVKLFIFSERLSIGSVQTKGKLSQVSSSIKPNIVLVH
jgi:hypothetical protein